MKNYRYKIETARNCGYSTTTQTGTFKTSKTLTKEDVFNFACEINNGRLLNATIISAELVDDNFNILEILE